MINMHVEMMWSLDVPGRGGGRAGGEGLGQMHTQTALGSRGCRKGSQCWPLSLCQDSALSPTLPMAKRSGGASQ